MASCYWLLLVDELKLEPVTTYHLWFVVKMLWTSQKLNVTNLKKMIFFIFYCSFYSFYLFCILPKLYFFSSSTISPKIFEHTHHTSTTTRGIYGSIQVGCSTRTWPDLIRWRKTQPTIDWKGVANWASYMWWVDQSTP